MLLSPRNSFPLIVYHMLAVFCWNSDKWLKPNIWNMNINYSSKPDEYERQTDNRINSFFCCSCVSVQSGSWLGAFRLHSIFVCYLISRLLIICCKHLEIHHTHSHGISERRQIPLAIRFSAPFMRREQTMKENNMKDSYFELNHWRKGSYFKWKLRSLLLSLDASTFDGLVIEKRRIVQWIATHRKVQPSAWSSKIVVVFISWVFARHLATGNSVE